MRPVSQRRQMTLADVAASQHVIDLDLTPGIPRRKKRTLPIAIFAIGMVGFGAVIAALGVDRLLFGIGPDEVGNFLGAGGGLIFASMGGLLYYGFFVGGVASMRLDGEGLMFTGVNGSVKKLTWTDRRVRLDLYDVSKMPESNTYVRDDPVWRYGLVVRAPFLKAVRFPQAGYDAVLAAARGHRMQVLPYTQNSRAFPSGETAFRIQPYP